MAAEHGWTIHAIEHELTDEHFVLLLDEAVDRHADRAQAEFGSMVEATRAGTIFAHDNRQYRRWRSQFDEGRRSSRAVTGEALEAAVRGIAAMFPGNVEVVRA